MEKELTLLYEVYNVDGDYMETFLDRQEAEKLAVACRGYIEAVYEESKETEFISIDWSWKSVK